MCSKGNSPCSLACVSTMCFVYVYSCICECMRVAISPPHLAPLTAWQDLALGEDGVRDGGEGDRDGGERGVEG